MFPAKFVMCNRLSNPKHICTSAHTHEKTLPNGTIKQLFYATFITLIRINNVYYGCVNGLGLTHPNVVIICIPSVQTTCIMG